MIIENWTDLIVFDWFGLILSVFMVLLTPLPNQCSFKILKLRFSIFKTVFSMWTRVAKRNVNTGVGNFYGLGLHLWGVK